MSVSCATYCETCNAQAAEIGDSGCVTTQPSLDPKWVELNGDLFPTFGFVYQCLASIHLVPFELAVYKEFLEEHKDHKVVFVTDYDDYEPQVDYESLKKITANRNDEKYLTGFYVMRNTTTMEFIKTSREVFCKFEAKTLTQEDIDFFIKNLVDKYEVIDSFHHCPASIDPYGELGEIISFVKRNRSASLEVFLEPDSKW